MNNKENSAPKLIEMEYNKGENHYVKINGEVFLFGVERQETPGCKTKWFRASPQHILAITPTGKDNQVACKDTLLAIEINADKKWYGGCIPDTGK